MALIAVGHCTTTAVTAVCVVAELFAVTGSVDDEVTVAVMLYGTDDCEPAGTETYTYTGSVAPAARLPIEQGKPEAHGARVEVTVQPLGNGSASATPVAIDGPLFLTII